MRKNLYDSNNRMLGAVEINSGCPNKQTLLDANNHVLGYYLSDVDKTYDENFVFYGWGNLLGMLLNK